MAKRKADSLTQGRSENSAKKIKQEEGPKKANLLDDSDSASSDESMGGVKLEEPGFKINKEYAKRFEHNSKREELQRLEEKYNKPVKPIKGQYGDKYDEDSESSDDEDEDDEGFLATEELDAEISATLEALKSKDPRVYDEKVTFYKPIKEGAEEGATPAKKEKPMYLSDYHREKLLKGDIGAEDEDEEAPRTFVQEQEDLKRKVVKEMHAAAEDDPDSGDDEDGGFLIPKSKPQPTTQGMHPSRAAKVKVNLDVESADKDPETFLSNFMAARAWVPGESSRHLPFESDDEEEDERAEKFESAYNLRFEDPKGSNEMLKSYARDIIQAKSVRREEPNSRKKQRDTLREKREAEKAERDQDRTRLRQLKIGEMEEKLQKIKKAAGIKGKTLKDEEWTKFLDENWDDDSWEAEMNKRFGEDYYAEAEAGSDDDSEAESKKKKNPKKPKWDDDIDIKDLIPDFVDDDGKEKPAFTLSDSEDQEEEDEDGETPRNGKTSKDRMQEKQAKKKAARLERKRIEEIVDGHLDIDLPLKSKGPTAFRYRETSPISFGLTARDILMAPDSQLNSFAGLKKMAAFRDPEKKRKDKKNLGKKARLRQWRKETFGNEDGPEVVIGANAGESSLAAEDMNIIEGKKKKKRSRKTKGPKVDA
ncbi:Protein kri1 [Lachnellula hyalina]|uniref:Protein kri1 n=1 Tax=Lachnellula hyalina TaxID=1316788 RepID=A0A8H8QVM3_9HELO|nr:Protein kri1 [Lachnellula hyalina]TVY23638.1 Protein kri1 [Lachnellula hyalina]